MESVEAETAVGTGTTEVAEGTEQTSGTDNAEIKGS